MSETTHSAADQAPPDQVTKNAAQLEEATASSHDPAKEVEDAKLQLLAAQQQLEAAQKRLDAAHAAANAQKPQPLLDNPPAAAAPVMPEPAQQPKEEASTSKEAPAAAYGDLGVLNGLFNGLAKIAPIALLFMLCCMAWPIFFEAGKGMYCPAETVSLSAFIHCVATGSWLAPTGLDNGAFSVAQWPGFTWLIAGLAFIPGLVDTGLVLPVASFTSTFLAVFGVWLLALSARFGGKAAFAAGLILLCAPLFAPMPHFMGSGALAAGMMLLAMAFFCHGWLANSAWLSLPIAFILTAVAGLCGGLLHFATPLLASLIFLIWRGTLRRAQKFDALFGFLLMLIVIGCWFGVVMADEARNQYLDLLMTQSFQFAWPIPWKWLLPVIAGLVGIMPWFLTVLGVSWVRVIGHSARTLGASRRVNGSAFVWVSLVLALGISLFVPAFHPSAIAIASLSVILLGKAFVHLTSAGNRFFFLLGGLCIIAAGVLMILITYQEPQQLVFSHLPITPPVPDLGSKLGNLTAVPVFGAVLILGGLLAFVFVRKYKGNGGLIFASILVIALCQVARLMLVPQLMTMPGTPLVPYATIEENVLKALNPAPAQAAPASPAPATTQAVPAVEKPVILQTEPSQTAPAEAQATKPDAHVAAEPVIKAPPATTSETVGEPDAAKPEAGAEAPAAQDAPKSGEAPKADAPNQEKVEEIIIVEEPVQQPQPQEPDSSR